MTPGYKLNINFNTMTRGKIRFSVYRLSDFFPWWCPIQSSIAPSRAHVVAELVLRENNSTFKQVYCFVSMNQYACWTCEFTVLWLILIIRLAE